MTNRPEMRGEGGREGGRRERMEGRVKISLHRRRRRRLPMEGGARAAVGWPVAPVVAALPPCLPPLRGHGHKFARFHLGRKLRPGPLLVLSREAINLLAQFASLTRPTTDIAATDPKRRQRRPPPSEASSAVDDRRQRWRRRRQAISPERGTFQDLHWSKNKDISCTIYHESSSSLNYTMSQTKDIACKKK